MYDEFGNKENEDQYPAGSEQRGESWQAQEETVEEYSERSETTSEMYEGTSEGYGAYSEESENDLQSAEAEYVQEELTGEADIQSETVSEKAEEALKVYGQEETAEYDRKEEAGQTGPEQSPADNENSFYHYSYGKNEQRENMSSGSGNPGNGYQHTQYYQNGQYHQRAPRAGQGNQGYSQDGSQSAQNQDPYRDASFRPVVKGGHKSQKAGGFGKKLGACVVLAVVFGLVASVVFQVSNQAGSRLAGSKETEKRAELQTQKTEETNVQSGTGVAAGAVDISAVAENAMPSIVAITNKGVEEVQSLFFGSTKYQPTESSGSGVIIAKNDTELLIATNNHVVDGAQELSVCFTVDTQNPEDAVVNAQVKGTDSDHDLAVVAVMLSDISEEVQSKLKVAVMGDSDAVKVGMQVIAIGNALGYGQSVTVGYVSALNREVTIDNISNNMIQTDAAINFGNSGGALLDTDGNLIGINSAKAADTGIEGMGYALPVNTASPILDELMNRTTRVKVADAELGFLGVDPRDVSEEARQIYNLPAGAFVYSVVEGSPAEQAGIKKGDIITKLDGITISSRDELFSRMEYYKAGETIDVVVKTAEGGDYVERTVSVTLAKKSKYNESSSSESEGSLINPESEQQGEGTQPEQFYDDDGYEYDENYGEGYDNSVEDFFRQFMW